MHSLRNKLTNTFNQFFESEKSSGLLLIACTVISLAIANSSAGPAYLSAWHLSIAGLSLEHWINDGLMAIFFLMVGLELEREFYSGELSSLRKALLPVMAAIGGMLAPALIHFSFNNGSATQAGIGIPMATDIAFAIGVLAMLGSRIPPSLKVFVVAFAAIDDLGAAALIAVFYTAQLSVPYLLGTMGVWLLLVGLNRLRIMALAPYLIGGVIMWMLMLKSGVHATIAGIALAFAVPFSAKQDDAASPSHKLEHWLHWPVAYLILPIFALANTGVIVSEGWQHSLLNDANALGITLGLVLGKPLGVMMMCALAVRLGVCQLPADLRWPHIMGAGLLGGIGFTMSIFITNLAFAGNAATINEAKMAILLASLSAGVLGYAWLRFGTKAATNT